MPKGIYNRKPSVQSLRALVDKVLAENAQREKQQAQKNRLIQNILTNLTTQINLLRELTNG